jgi:hypothetical protein
VENWYVCETDDDEDDSSSARICRREMGKKRGGMRFVVRGEEEEKRPVAMTEAKTAVTTKWKADIITLWSIHIPGYTFTYVFRTTSGPQPETAERNDRRTDTQWSRLPYPPKQIVRTKKASFFRKMMEKCCSAPAHAVWGLWLPQEHREDDLCVNLRRSRNNHKTR